MHDDPNCNDCVFWATDGLCGHDRALIDGERKTREFMRNDEGPRPDSPSAPKCFRGRLFVARNPRTDDMFLYDERVRAVYADDYPPRRRAD